MLSQEQKKILDFYRFPNGMLNVGWIAGYLRGVKPGAKMFYIQQTNNANLMLPVYLKDGDSIPSRFQEFSPVRLICHIDGEKVEGTSERIAKAYVIGFDMANVLDMPPSSAFDKVPPPGAPVENVDFRPFTGHEERMSDSSNIVRIAGFVQSVVMSGAKQGEQADCCIILIRQKEDEGTSIPVRYYSKRLAEAVHNRIGRGAPIQIDAALRVRAKPIGEADPETGIVPVVKYPYLHAINPPGGATPREILRVPEWAQSLYNEYRAVRTKSDKKPAEVATPKESKELDD